MSPPNSRQTQATSVSPLNSPVAVLQDIQSTQVPVTLQYCMATVDAARYAVPSAALKRGLRSGEWATVIVAQRRTTAPAF